MDMNKMMKQVQKMQAELAKAQDELAVAVVEGQAGGGAVVVEFTGEEASKVTIAADAVDPDDPGMLEDLVRAAINSALSAKAALAAERLGPLTGGMGMGLPGMPGMR
ncbi:MAG TPA: YbaB/EbfC family nucleoid-associated protein [Actinomycetota bacterium]|nr:YbaB/EbfC family nucleoid-associated protein [Actinomycetota bacterium]